MSTLTVYADILIVTNLIIDYFLLAATGKIIRRKPKLLRHLISSFAAAVSTLIIFLPQQSKTIEFLFRLAISYIICLLCFGFHSFRRFLYSGAVFFAVTFCYAGAMIAVWYIFKPYGMVINNSIVYFGVSPLFLIAFSVLGFLIFSLVSSILGRRNKSAEECFVTLTFRGVNADFRAIIDSGNSLTDAFSKNSVIIADKGKTDRVFGELSLQKYPERYRVIPCSTVSGEELLDGFRCDGGKIILKEKIIKLSHPILAVSKTPMRDFEAIVNPEDCE